jgi:hypothetical protein
MRYGTFQEACQSLFAVRSRHDPPNKTHIGRVLPDEVEVDSPNASTRKVRDRALLYPLGLRSPDLPCFEEVEEDEEVEDEADDTGESADEGEAEGQ